MASKLLYRCTDVVSAPITLRFLLTSSLASLALIFALTSSLVASISFYRILIPPASLSTPVYLQYGQGIPSAEFTVPKDLKGNQQYDILLAIDAPASRKNLDLGTSPAAALLILTIDAHCRQLYGFAHIKFLQKRGPGHKPSPCTPKTHCLSVYRHSLRLLGLSQPSSAAMVVHSSRAWAERHGETQCCPLRPAPTEASYKWLPHCRSTRLRAAHISDSPRL